MINFYGDVGLRSDLPLEALAAHLSVSLCAGIEFGGGGEGVKDEVPAVYTLRTFVGLGLTLYGEPGDYGLELWQEPDTGPAITEVDVSSYLCALLNTIEGVYAYIPHSD